MRFKRPKIKLGTGQNTVLMLFALFFLFLILFSFFGMALLTMFSVQGYEGGYEVRTTYDSVYIGGKVNKWYTWDNTPNGDVPLSYKSVQFDPTPRTVKNWDYVYEPDIYISVDDPIHTKEDSYHNLIKNDDGQVIQAPLEDYIREIVRDVGDERKFFYVHTYAYSVTVKTQADQINGAGAATELEAKGEEGRRLYFTVRSKFAISPWNIVGNVVEDESTGDEYEVTTGWAGVLAASVEVAKHGFNDAKTQALWESGETSASALGVDSGWEIIKPQIHSPAPLWKDQTTKAESNEVPSSDADIAAIEGVPSTVYIDVSGMIFAGCEYYVFPETVHNSVPYDMFIQLTIRVDVLTCSGFTPISGTDPIADPPQDEIQPPPPYEFPFALSLGLLFGQFYWVIMVIVGVMALVLIAIVATRARAIYKAFKG